MTVLLFALIGTCLALAVVVLALLRGSRETTGTKLQCDQQPSSEFVCKWRLAGTSRWPRRRARAMWVHDVLIVKTGRIHPRISALPVRLPEDVIREARPDEAPGLGPHPMMITLRLDDDQLIDVASSEHERSLLVGPFCAAAIPGLRPGRVERLPRKPTGPSRKPDPKKRD